MSTNQSNAQAPQAESNYINLHVTGLGYLKRIREVKLKGKGTKPFMACSISAMFGEKGVEGGVQYTPFDVKAVSAQAEEVLKTFAADANNPNKRLMVQFKIGDPYIDTFTYQSGDKAGQLGTAMKGRLLKINRLWVKNLAHGKGSGDQADWTLAYELPKEPLLSEDANVELQRAA